MHYRNSQLFLILTFVLLMTSFAQPRENRFQKLVINSSNAINSISSKNTIYVVSGVVDLKGETIQIPRNCVLDFQKGSVTNGVLLGDNTQLKGLHRKCIGFRSNGTWIVSKIDDSFFDDSALTDDQIISAINTFQNDSVKNCVIIKKERYNCTIKKNDGCLLKLSSNTNLVLKTTISISGNDYNSYNIIRIKDKKNVSVKGGVLLGDVGKHEYVEESSSQWGHGVYICNSENVTIKNMTVMRCVGDGFTITGGKASHYGDMSQASRNVLICNVVARCNRRQGISIIYANNVIVKNSVFSETGTIEYHSPSAGLDIEPNLAPYNQSVHNVRIVNCRFEKNIGASILSNHYENYLGTRSVEGVTIVDCYCDGRLEFHTGGISVSRSSMLSLLLSAERDPITEITLTGCKILGDGISMHCANKKREIEPGINNIRFERCKIATPGEVQDCDNANVFFRSGKIENIRDISFHGCQIESK